MPFKDCLQKTLRNNSRIHLSKGLHSYHQDPLKRGRSESFYKPERVWASGIIWKCVPFKDCLQKTLRNNSLKVSKGRSESFYKPERVWSSGIIWKCVLFKDCPQKTLRNNSRIHLSKGLHSYHQDPLKRGRFLKVPKGRSESFYKPERVWSSGIIWKCVLFKDCLQKTLRNNSRIHLSKGLHSYHHDPLKRGRSESVYKPERVWASGMIWKCVPFKDCLHKTLRNNSRIHLSKGLPSYHQDPLERNALKVSIILKGLAASSGNVCSSRTASTRL